MEISYKSGIYGIISEKINFNKLFQKRIISISDLIDNYDYIYKSYKKNQNLFLDYRIININVDEITIINKFQIIITYYLIKGNVDGVVFIDSFKNFDLKNEKEFIKLIQVLKRKYKLPIFIVTKDTNFLISNTDYIYFVKLNKIIKKETTISFFYDCDFLISNKICIPEIVQFDNVVYKIKGIKLNKRKCIDDLIKDIYRSVCVEKK